MGQAFLHGGARVPRGGARDNSTARPVAKPLFTNSARRLRSREAGPKARLHVRASLEHAEQAEQQFQAD
jgi:hypothetical protein